MVDVDEGVYGRMYGFLFWTLLVVSRCATDSLSLFVSILPSSSFIFFFASSLILWSIA